MLKTKIEWCDSIWNPVTGCLHGCEYCYARSIAKRFGGANDGEVSYEREALWTFDGEENGQNHVLDYPYKWYSDDGNTVRNAPYPFYFDPTFHRYRLNDYMGKQGRNIFVCSMADLFGQWVPDEWIREVFNACEKATQHRYLFLTKYPERYTEYGVPADENKWYGVSITQESEMRKFNDLPVGCNIFVSVEPVLEDLRPEKHNILFRQVGWIILGAESGNRKDRVMPQAEWIKNIVWHAKERKVPIFMKDSLIPIVGEENMQREFPWESDGKEMR